MYFTDRIDAGRQLAARLTHLKDSDVVVLGLPRGGVPVAEQVAESLAAPLDICLVRKLGVPYQPELAMGAVGEGGVRVLNDDVLSRGRVTSRDLAAVEERELALLDERAARYRGARHPVPLRGRTVVVVDDGLATGATALAACRVVRARDAARIVLAVPVAPAGWRAERVGNNADEAVCVHEPAFFQAIGQFYLDFSQTPDEDVVACLDRNRAAYGAGDDAAAQAAEGAAGLPPTEVRLPVGGAEVGGELTVPEGATGIVVFAHGSGSSRHSPRNRAVAAALNRAGLGTLLFDLLTDAEAANRANVFDTELLAGRLTEAAAWVGGREDTRRLRTGFFGASTGAAAALGAAAARPPIAAVVSRGGRPDLAGPSLARVGAHVLLIVGGRDTEVLELNERAHRSLATSEVHVISGAGHLFEEPGALEEVTAQAADWFNRYL